jgi:hypothetical protein
MSTMFTPEDRDHVRERVFAIARGDERVTGGAVTGSRSIGREDRWSDLDTAFGVAPGVAPEPILRDWTQQLEREFDVVHRFDLQRGSTSYRVFLFDNGLEVDVSLTPSDEFGPHGPTFELVFGDSREQPSHDVSIDEVIGFGWIFVFYGRTAIERGRPWQAEYGISGVRDRGLALACIRHDLPSTDARGIDELPAVVREPWNAVLVRSLDEHELRRALSAAAAAFTAEVDHVAPVLAGRLRQVFPA